MRGILGITLIGAGLLGAYLILSGKFPPPAATSTATPKGTPASGSGGESIQSSFTQLGTSIAMHPRDMRASRGFKA